MSLSRHQTPLEEYEERQAERRARARFRVSICYAITCVPYVSTWFVGMLWSEHAMWPFLVAFGVTWMCGVATGVVTLCHWPVLTWGDRAFGLAPWFYFTLTSFPFVMMLLR